MVKEPRLALQAAVLSKLNAVPYISSNSIPVKGKVPKGTPVPFITIGDMNPTNDSTQGVALQTVTLTIHTWDEGLDTTRLKSMMAAVQLGLDNTALTIASPFIHISTQWLNSQILEDPDGLTMHGVQRFRVELQNS